jgi:hypothetical protein
MSTTITCPNCKTQFEAEAGIAQSIKDDLTNEYNRKWADLQKKKEEDFRRQEQMKEEQYKLLAQQRDDQYRQLEKQKEELFRQQEKQKEALYKQKEQQWAEQEKRNNEQMKLREQQLIQQQNDMARKLDEEKKALETRLTKELETKVGADFDHKLKMLEEANKASEAKLSEARSREVDFLKKMQELSAKEQEMELELQRKMMEERGKLSELIKKEEEEKSRLRDAEYQMRLREKEKQMEEQRKQVDELNKLRDNDFQLKLKEKEQQMEEQRRLVEEMARQKDTDFQMKLKEKEKQLEDQYKLIEEMKRKSEQGSMQLQGEVQELELEKLLTYAFPFDLVSEVGKGVKGADCIQTVRNSFGQECGRIIFESKRTKDFSQDWIEKLKADMRVLGADVAVIVTQAMPKDMTNFGERDGIWICSFGEVRALVHVLRELVIKVYNATKSQENKGDKMTLLYNYLVSGEFSEQWSAIREGFLGMKMSIQRERDQMEKMWNRRHGCGP